MKAYGKLFEEILQEFTSTKYSGELASAKHDFFEKAGILNDESEEFELRMAQFFDWYLFSRELSEKGMSPIELLVHEAGGSINISEVDAGKAEEETNQEGSKEDIEYREGLEVLINYKHSLYQYLKTKKQDVYIQDIFNKEKIIIKNSDVDLSFNSEEIFEARIINLKDQLCFTKGFCFHPVEAKKFILSEVKKTRNMDKQEHKELIYRLLKMRYKHSQYQHIKLDYIYTNEPKLKF